MISNKKREQQWKKGIHTDADGNEHRISDPDDMTDGYLAATINSFPNLAVQPLRRELHKRHRGEIEAVVGLLRTESVLKSNSFKRRKRAKRAHDFLTKLFRVKVRTRAS